MQVDEIVQIVTSHQDSFGLQGFFLCSQGAPSQWNLGEFFPNETIPIFKKKKKLFLLKIRILFKIGEKIHLNSIRKGCPIISLALTLKGKIFI